jgi:hypothetical protein
MEMMFMDTRTQESLVFQFVPAEIEYDPASEFQAIATFARNNPRYHYTGSEDTITFELDWHAEVELKNDVLRKCRWIEARTKNDAYNNPPPLILFKWGDIFTADDLWLITHAPYRLSNFDKIANMRPKQAYQKITLKRVTKNNRSYSEITQIPI